MGWADAESSAGRLLTAPLSVSKPIHQSDAFSCGRQRARRLSVLLSLSPTSFLSAFTFGSRRSNCQVASPLIYIFSLCPLFSCGPRRCQVLTSIRVLSVVSFGLSSHSRSGRPLAPQPPLSVVVVAERAVSRLVFFSFCVSCLAPVGPVSDGRSAWVVSSWFTGRSACDADAGSTWAAAQREAPPAAEGARGADGHDSVGRADG